MIMFDDTFDDILAGVNMFRYLGWCRLYISVGRWRNSFTNMNGTGSCKAYHKVPKHEQTKLTPPAANPSVCSTLRVKDFLYLDSAHLKGETLLEITEAYRLMRPGGVLLGDDLDWPAVESDLSEFLKAQKIRQWLGDDSEVWSAVFLVFVASLLSRCW